MNTKKFYIKTVIVTVFLTAVSAYGVWSFQNRNATASPQISLAQTNLSEGPLLRAQVQKSWLSRVQENLVQRSYRFSPSNKSDYVSYNAAQQLGISVQPFDMSISGNPNQDASWNTSFHFSSAETNISPINAGNLLEAKTSDNFLTYIFENIAIQYSNSNEGLRQNFIINNAPAGSTSLKINLSFNSSLYPHIYNNNLYFSYNSIPLYSYGNMKVWDKTGKELSANMQLNNNLVSLNVDVSNAQFPVTIDPLSMAPLALTYSWKGEGNSPKAGFGFWLSGNSDINGDGYSDVVIGAPGYTNTLVKQGAVFIYYGSNTGLALTPNVTIYGDQAGANFGKCVSSEGDVNGDGFADLIVGANKYTNPMEAEGKAFLYYGSATGLNTTPVWTFESNRKKAELGGAVSIVGDMNGDGYDDVAVGANGWDDNEVLGDAGNKAGKFWVFLGSASGLSATAAIFEVGEEEDANLGVSLDRAGDVNGDGYMDLNVGGYIFLIGDGFVCIFNGAPVPDNMPDFMAIGGAHDTSFFAVNISTAGDLNGDGYDDIVVGAPRFDYGGVYQAGKLDVFYGGPDGLDTAVGWVVGGTQYDERFAFNVNEGGDLNKDGYDDLLVTSKHWSFVPGDSVGEGLLYLGGPNGPSQTPIWLFKGESIQAVGSNIFNAGDVNGDGYDDILLSGDTYSNGEDYEGGVFLFNGTPQNCDPPTGLVNTYVGPTTASFQWNWLYGAQNYKMYLKKIGAPGAPVLITTYQSSITVTGLDPNSSYRVYIKGKCDGGLTARTQVIIIHTLPLRTAMVETGSLILYPNPVRNVLNINTANITGNSTLRIYDMKGSIVYEKIMNVQANELITIDEVNKLDKGFYMLSVDNDTQHAMKKFIKAE